MRQLQQGQFKENALMPNNSMHRTALRAAADAERYT
jgi:hypothetical protein